MSTRATRSSRAAARAIKSSRHADKLARQAREAERRAREALDAAVAAHVAAGRAGSGDTGDAAAMHKVGEAVSRAADEAVEHAQEAMIAEGEGDVVGAVHEADLSAKAACRAAALSAAASLIVRKARELTPVLEVGKPKPATTKTRKATTEEKPADSLAAAIDQAARYLVTYDGRIVASLAREEDAFLLESELADLDRAHGTTSGKCEVIERKSGHRLGGYLLAGSQMVVFVRDERHETRFGKRNS